MMLKYRGAHSSAPASSVWSCIALVIAVGLQPEQLTTWATSVRYQALFTEAGGLAAGNDVTIAGIKIGSVSDVSLRQGRALVTFTVDSQSARLADHRSHPHRNPAGRACSHSGIGRRRPAPHDVIPASRTSSPYSLTDAVSDLPPTSPVPTPALNQSLDTLSSTIDQIAPQLGPTFDGLTRLSQSLNKRNETLAELLKHAADVTEMLSQRSAQVNTLILNANDLVGVLVERRQAIVDLLETSRRCRKQLSGLVADNESKLAPTLDKLNSVTAMLEKNRDNIAKALPGLAKYEPRRGDVANGPYYTASSLTSSRRNPATVPGLRLRVPPRYRRRPTAGQCRAAGRTSVPVQRNSRRTRSAFHNHDELEPASSPGGRRCARGGARRRGSPRRAQPSSGPRRSPRTSPLRPPSIRVTTCGCQG